MALRRSVTRRRYWNGGIELERLPTPSKDNEEMAAARAAAMVATAAGRPLDAGTVCALGMICYHCASMPNAVRASHTFVDCPKRKRAHLREYTAGAMTSARQWLASRRAASEAVVNAQACASRGNQERWDRKEGK